MKSFLHRKHKEDKTKKIPAPSSSSPPSAGNLSDSEFAHKLAQEEEDAARGGALEGRNGAELETPLGDSAFAKLLAAQENNVGVELTDSDFARLVEAEDRFSAQTSQPLPSAGDHHQPLTDSEFARRLQLQISSSSAPPSPAISSNALSKFYGLYSAYGPSFAGRPEIETGNKIILPVDVLQRLGDAIEGQPLIFQIGTVSTWGQEGTANYCGVIDFTSPHSSAAILPLWMIKNLKIAEGDEIKIKVASLAKGTYIKLQPLNADFEDLENPKAVLEEHLSYNYCSLAKGTNIFVRGEGKVHELMVLECQPSDTISIVEAQLDVDLQPPLQPVLEKHTQLTLGIKFKGKTEADKYAYFKFEQLDEAKNESLVIVLEPLSGDPDLYVDQLHKKPNRHRHTWASTTTGEEQILLSANDPARKKGPFWIGVRGHKSPAEFQIGVFKVLQKEEKKEQERNTDGNVLADETAHSDSPPGDGFVRCLHCLHWIPDVSSLRHEAFCSRTNYRCSVPGCGKVMRAADKASHWHCPICGIVDDIATHWHCTDCGEVALKEEHWHCPKCNLVLPLKEKDKHFEIKHTALSCSCGAQFDMDAMVDHKATACPLRLVECQYCSNVVPWKDLHGHKEQCGATTRPCEVCKKRVPLKSMEAHYVLCHNNNEDLEQAHIDQPTSTNTLPSQEMGGENCGLCGAWQPDTEELQVHLLTSCPFSDAVI